MPLDTQPLPIRISALLLAILVAGLLAGLIAAAFHTIATEPIIDQAIALEEMRHAAEETSEPVVTRDAQKVGLFVGWIALGLVYAALLAASYAIARTRSWLKPGWAGPLLLAGVGYTVIVLFPALKYPANPPGVGDPGTIAFRQTAFVASWVLALIGSVLAVAMARHLSLSMSRKAGAAIAMLTVWLLALYFLLPSNPDPVTMPSAIVDVFRVRSIEGLTLFWLALGMTFAAFSARLTGKPSAT